MKKQPTPAATPAATPLINPDPAPLGFPYRSAIGWTPSGPTPTIEDLLPSEVKQKFLALWIATGVNLLLEVAVEALDGVVQENPDVLDAIFQAVNSDVSDRLSGLRKDWSGRAVA